MDLDASQRKGIAGSGDGPRTVLVADDSGPDRGLLATLLGHQGYRVTEAGDGAAALARARAERPDLIITDALMPRMDGVALTRAVRADPVLADIRVLIHTTTPAAADLARAAGADHCLIKLTEPAEILAAVRELLGDLAPPPRDAAPARCGGPSASPEPHPLLPDQADRLDLSRDAILVRRRDGAIIFWNRGAETLYGWPRKAAVGRLTHDLLAAEYPQPPAEIDGQLDRTGCWAGRVAHRRKDGSRVIVASRWVLWPGGAGRAPAVLETNTDITALVQAEEAVRECEAEFGTLTQALAEGVLLVTPDGHVSACNLSAEAILGVPAAGILGRHVAELRQDPVRPDGTPFTTDELPVVVTLRTGQPVGWTAMGFTQPGGRRVWVSVNSVPLPARRSPASGAVVSFLDITDRFLAEEALRRLNEELEARVRDRTARLAAVADRLRREVADRAAAEAGLAEAVRRLRELTARQERVREEERVRLARDVHDQLGQALTGLNMDLYWLQGRLARPGGDADCLAKVEEMRGLVADTVRTVRRIAGELRPPALDTLGLADALEWQAQEFARRTGVRCTVTRPDAPPRLDPDRAVTLFRIAQEALTNVARHAAATAVTLELRQDAADVVLEVRDDGRGIAAAAVNQQQSLGLLGMQERAFLLGGRIDIIGVAGQGTRVTVRIPADPRPDDPEAVEPGGSPTPGGP